MLGASIRRIRLDRGKTQAWLGHCADVSQVTVAHWEAGRAMPRMAHAIAVARALNVTLDELCPVSAEGIAKEEEPTPAARTGSARTGMAATTDSRNPQEQGAPRRI